MKRINMMDIPNKISKNIDITEAKSRLDASCKKLLSFKIFLAHILKNCIEEFKNFDQEEIADKYIEGEPKISEIAVHQDEEIKGMNTESTSVSEKTVRYDILFYAFVPVLEETVEFIINIEAQNEFSPDYPLLKRAVYYCSRLISSQRNKDFGDSGYKDIKKVFSIWICTSTPKNKQNTITRFSFTQKNLIGKAIFDKKDYDLMEIIMVCLGKNHNDENYSGLIKLLDVLLSDKIKADEKKKILENEYNIKMTESIEREVLGMCNISDGVYERGRLSGIVDMCKEFGVSFIDTVKRIAADFNLSEQEAEEEVRKYW
ncbi:MAG: hypothetical protein HFE59_11110 [Clostridiales bacterium]|nr:hypothetical protein [Clostridiales bacterium]